MGFSLSLSRSLDTLGKLWTAPNTLIGILIGMAGIPFGARPRIGNNALQFINYPIGIGALTLGNAVIYARGTAPADCCHLYGCEVALEIGKHEEAHTRQYQVLGPFFLPVYFACGGVSARNPLEQAANAYAQGGRWWPWWP